MTKLEVFRDEELYIVERNGRYAVHGMLDGKRVRQACGTNNLARAKLVLESVRRQHEMRGIRQQSNRWKIREKSG